MLKFRLALTLAALCGLAWISARSPRWIAFAAPVPAPVTTHSAVRDAVVPSVQVAAVRPRRRVLTQVQQAPAAPSPAASPVAIAVEVTDSQGNTVTGLTRDDFRVYDQDVEQSVTSFERRPDRRAVGIIVVVHDSSSKQAWQVALARFTARLGPSVVISTLLDQGDDHDTLLALSSATMSRLNQDSSLQHVLLIISDRDTPEFAQFQADREAGRPIQTGPSLTYTYAIPNRAPGDLEQFSLRDVSADIPTYQLNFTPSGVDQAAGSFHFVTVVVDRPGISIRTRNGYYAGEK